MEMQHMHENVLQCKSCRGEGDASIWGARASDAHDKQVNKCPNCHVFKSGTLSISSKGIGWTSWKKRWFILTRTSLVFFRSDPNAPLQKGSEVNLTLGGIDLNNSGSVVVKADKKLLTVLFPDGRDGRAFTLKAETLEDMYEWKTALENALAQAPSATLAMGQTGIFRNDVMESIEASFEQWKDKKPIKSMIIGRPVLLALEDVDGSPSFLEKALRFIEQYGVKVEGILRQSADVEEVERRVQEYEQGKNEFSPDEDAHVICDCIKHVLRELPTSPVPASCCTALLEAFRSNRAARISAIRTVVSEMLPEPNRRLLQRILMMMREVASHKSENRMAISAVAACMSPLLLRPLLAGDCVFEDAFDMGGDGSIQLLQAAAAANHAQAIVIILLEEYEKIFLEGAFSSELYSGSEDCDDDGGDEEEEEEQEDEDGDEDGDEDEDEGDEEEITDDEILEHGGYHDAQNDVDHSTEDALENESIGTGSLDESGTDLCGDLYENKALEDHDLGVVTPKSGRDIEASERGTETAPSTATQHDINEELSISPHSPLPEHAGTPKSFSPKCENSNSSARITDFHENLEGAPRSVYPMQKSISDNTSSGANNCQLQQAVSNVTSSCATNCQLQKSVSIVTSSSAHNCQLQKTVSVVTSSSPTDCQLQKSVSNVTTCNSLMQKSVNNINPCDTSSPVQKSACDTTPFCCTKLTDKSNVPIPKTKRPTVWGRTSARKNLSLESIEFCSDDESEIQRLEIVKSDLQVKIAKEVQGNAMLQSRLEKRKEALHEHRLALQKDVKRLQEQLQKERDLRASLESGLINMRPGHLCLSSIMDHKMRADLEEIALAEADVISLKEIVSDLRGQLDQQLGQNYGTLCESCGQQQYAKHLSIQRDQPKYVPTPVNPCYREDSPRREEVPCSVTDGHVKTQKMDKPDLQNRQTSGKQCPETKGQTSTKPIGASNNSASDVSSSNESTVYSKRSINSEEVPCNVTDEHMKTQMDMPDLQNRQTSGKQCPETRGLMSTKPIGPSNCSTSDVSSSNKSTVYSKRSINSENSGSLADYENPKSLTEDHPDSLDKLPPEKQKLSSMSLNGGKSREASFSSFTEETSTAGDNAASDLSIMSEIGLCGIDFDNAKRSIQDSCPPDKQISQQHQATLETPSSVKSVDSGISISAQATLGRISASKKSLPKPEDTNVTSSSSALSRLTNRLNFLKERRVQLVNELQNLGTDHSEDPDRPPLRPYSR